jgi:hypothetical protein
MGKEIKRSVGSHFETLMTLTLFTEREAGLSLTSFQLNVNLLVRVFQVNCTLSICHTVVSVDSTLSPSLVSSMSLLL